MPHEGEKVDPAHPAIYPTGELGKIKERQVKVYDLIVRRTLATFASPAKRKIVTAVLDVNNELFVARGAVTVEKGWHAFYGIYTPIKDEKIPDLKEKQVIKKPKIESLEKETQPPKRYTQASIIKELEKRNLGTKATRAAIIDALYLRHYVTEKTLKATKLGIATIETLEKFCPEIIDDKLTEHFEKEMEEIRDQ